MVSVLCVLVALLVSGCSLAKQDQQSPKNQDQLCGVYISLDSWGEWKKDEEAMNAHAEKYGWSDNWHPKHYATVVKKDGEEEYVFEDLKGVGMFLEKEGDTTALVECKSSSGALSDLGVAHHLDESDGSTGNSRELSGTVKLARSKEERVVQTNPIRKDEKGYYVQLDATGGVLVDGEGNIGGTLTSKEEQTVEMEGVASKKEGFSWKVTIDVSDALQKVTVREMDRRDQQICEHVFTVKDGDVDMKLNEKTAWILVEEIFRAQNGSTYVKHTAYDRDEGEEEPWGEHICNYAGRAGLINPATLYFAEQGD